MSAIKRAVQICGGQAKLGAAVGVTQSRVSQWIKGEPIPVRYFPAIQRVTDGVVSVIDLLNDELAKLPDADAAEQAELERAG